MTNVEFEEVPYKYVPVEQGKFYRITTSSDVSYVFKAEVDSFYVKEDTTVTLLKSGTGKIKEHVAEGEHESSIREEAFAVLESENTTQQLKQQRDDLLRTNNQYLERYRRAENALCLILNSSDSQMRDGDYARELARRVLNVASHS